MTRCDAHVIIVTYGRSGSTLLQNLLNNIDGYCVRGENNNVSYFLAKAWYAVKDAKPLVGLRGGGERSATHHPWYGGEQIDTDALGHLLADCLVAEVLKPPPGCRVAGFKEIRFHNDADFFVQHLDFLFRFLPNCRFIFNSRNHSDVAISGWWAHEEHQSVIRYLAKADDLSEAYLAAHPDRGIKLHYDNYAGQPDALRPLFEFLGEPFDLDLVGEVLKVQLRH